MEAGLVDPFHFQVCRHELDILGAIGGSGADGEEGWNLFFKTQKMHCLSQILNLEESKYSKQEIGSMILFTHFFLCTVYRYLYKYLASARIFQMM